MNDSGKLSQRDQEYVQAYIRLCLTASQKQNEAVTGSSDPVQRILADCLSMQTVVREMANTDDPVIRSSLNTIAEHGMLFAQRPQGVGEATFFQEVAAACRKLGFEAVPGDS